MKTKTNVTLYICDHCKKKLLRKWAMEKHEKYCGANPENRRACEGCQHLEETTVEVIYEGIYQDRIVKSKAFRCKALEKMLYPLKVEQRGLLEKYPETFEDQEPMPRTCEHGPVNPSYDDCQF